MYTFNICVTMSDFLGPDRRQAESLVNLNNKKKLLKTNLNPTKAIL